MIGVILAAGRGSRLQGGDEAPPKCLMQFGGKSLLQRHLDHLATIGVTEVLLVIGYQAAQIEAHLATLNHAVETRLNPDYTDGSIVSLWHARDWLQRGESVIVMDADVLYDPRMLSRLKDSAHPNCMLLDREVDDGPEPVRICMEDGQPVEFRKQARVACDYFGESVGFFRLSAPLAAVLASKTEQYVQYGQATAPHEEAIRDLLLESPGVFGVEDVTGIPWIEIDFPDDVIRAREQILPQLEQPVSS